MTTFAEWTRGKKKKNQEIDPAGMTFREYTMAKLGLSEEDFADDVAPVRTSVNTTTPTTTAPAKKEEEKERKWFEKGAFGDGKGNIVTDTVKTVLGSVRDVEDNVTAGILGIGEKVVDTLAYLAPAMAQSQQAQYNPYHQFDIKEYREQQAAAQKFMEKDLYDEEKLAKKISIGAVGNIAKGFGIDADENSVFGEKTDSLLQSGGQLAATAGLQAVGVPWWLTTGATSFGGELENAFKQGASYEEAGGSALITAGADILTEKLSGGIKFGGKTLDDGLTRMLSEKIANKAVRTATKLGMDAAGEGAEEVIAGVISNLGTSLYKEESIGELLTSEEAIDEYIESFIGGAALGGGVSSVNVIRSAQSGRDYTTGLTDNEQKVVDKEIANRIAEREASGTKIDKKEKSAIREQVQKDLEKGYIDVDTIESVLGGETYESYKTINEQESALKKEIETLENMPREQITVKQGERLAEARKQLEELGKTSNKTQLKEQLSKEVDALTTKDTFLRESFNEKSRRSQKFEADLTKYDAKQQEVIKRAAESGILNNTNKTHEFVDMIAKISADKGVLFDFTDNQKLKESGFAVEGKTVNGYIKDGNVAVNINSNKALNSVVGHEITHVLEGTELYTELQAAVKEYATTKGEYDTRLQSLTKLYEGVEGANIENELTADLIGDYLFTDSDFINKLSTEKPNIFKKVYEEIKYLYKVATAGSKEAKELEKVKRAFDKAYKEIGNTETAVKNSLNPGYAQQVDEWYNNETEFAKHGGSFDVGRTSDALKSIGVKEQNIVFDKSKIKEIMNKHPEMTLDVIKTIPEAVENPVIVMQSKTAKDSITIYGEVYAKVDGKEQPVMVAMLLSPQGKSGRILNLEKISSAYVRGAENSNGNSEYVTQKSQDLINTSDILYVDPNKKRTDTWLSALGLQLPLGLTQYGSIGKVTYYNDVVNNNDADFGKSAFADAFKRANIDLSLSDNSKGVAPMGNYNVYGSDIALETTQNTVETTQTESQIAPVTEIDEYAPLTEAEANERDAQQSDRLNSLSENDMPEEAEAPYYDDALQPVEPESPFDERDIKDVGNRKVKAYMYENPEVKPYFQEEAQNMLYELKNSIKGERNYNDQLYYDSGGDLGWFGTHRQTSEQLAYMLDTFKYTYAQLEKGLNAIIEDHGAENNAVSKRLEFMIDERLREGYVDFLSGYSIPANQDYINLLTDKQINAYSDEAYNQWLETLAQEEAADHFRDPAEMIEDIAPVKEQEATEPAKMASTQEETVLQTENGNQLRMNPETGEITEDIPTKTRKELQKALLEEHAGEIETGLDNAKNIPMMLMNNTDTIRLSEMVFGRETGRLINDTIFQKAIDNEAHSVRWQNKERAEIKKLGVKAGSKESQAVQKYGEGQYVDENNNVFEYGDAELAAEFPNVETQRKIIATASAIRAKYDTYLDLANQSLTGLGFDPIPKRKDYFRHFQELNDAFTRFGLPFNAQNMQEHVLPTDINGLTEFWSPQKNYFANAQPRKGMKTELDAIKGIDGYISGISNLIYHTEDIQRGRAFEEMIRNRFGEEHGFDNFDNLTPEEQQERIKKVQENHLSNYAAWVHEWTNNIAGKKNKVDRAIEATFGRKAFAFLDETRKQVGANMIGFNVSSSLTNGIASVQAMAKTNPLAVVKGTGDTIKNIFVKDNFMDKNTFLANRMGTDMLAKKPWEKMRDAGYVFMKGMDWFTSNQIVRSKYYELRSKGLSEENAHAEAGKFAARVMGDRTKGANPQIYNSKLLGLVTQFQLEVNNQLYSMFYDTYQESKEHAKGNALKTAAGMTFTLGAMSAMTHVYGQTFEAIAGYNPTFDIIEMIKLAFGGDEEDEEKTTSERLKAAADKLVDSLPYVNILTGGGRIPVASGIPNLVGVATGGKDEYGNELTLEDELKKLLYLIPPTGGNQIKKTTQGLKMFSDEHPVTGSYTDSGNLRFPVEDTPLNRAQAAIFGQWASENAGEYFDREQAPLKEKQIQEFADLDIPIKDYWEYREGLAKQKTLDEKFDYIAGLDLPVSKKNIMINNIVDRKETVDMTNYDDFETYEEFDFATKNPEKHDFFQSNNISYQEYNASEDSREAYNWAYKNPEKYELSKAITNDVTVYREYKKGLSDIEADKDSEGNSISGTKKEKVINYINGLDAEYGAKLILFKSEYTADDTYNEEIIEYLNNKADITYSEMETILKELGFTVEADGTIRW